MKNKLDSVMERLVRLCSEDCDGGLRSSGGDHQWAKLFEWVIAVDPACDYADPLLALSGRLGTAALHSATVSAQRDTKNARVIFWLCPEWRKISGTPSSSVKWVAYGPA